MGRRRDTDPRLYYDQAIKEGTLPDFTLYRHVPDIYTEVDERAAWFYKATTSTKGMKNPKPGFGQAYLASYDDSAGEWLDGAKNYRLRIPPDPPAVRGPAEPRAVAPHAIHDHGQLARYSDLCLLERAAQRQRHAPMPHRSPLGRPAEHHVGGGEQGGSRQTIDGS